MRLKSRKKSRSIYNYSPVVQKQKKKKTSTRRWWITKLFQNKLNNDSSNLLSTLKFDESTGQYKNFLRMSSEDFEYLINLVGPKIQKNDTHFRRAIPVKQRLAVTLRFLATGDSYTSLQYLFRISKQIISLIIPEVCKALIEGLQDNIKLPSNPDEWLTVCEKFETLWNFPHCLGAMDGKHIVLQAPIHSGSEFHNYKSFFSIVLFALVDAEYNFLYANVGCEGRISDGGVFRNSDLFQKLKKNCLNLPTDSTLPGKNKKIPYVFLGDEAFPLMQNIMKPYSGLHPAGSRERIFNYRLSRFRRVVENVFGIMSAIFRVLRKPLLLEPNKAEIIVMAVVHLHNFLRNSTTSKNTYLAPTTLDKEHNGEIVSGSWRNSGDLCSLHPIKNVPRRSTELAKEIREDFSDYFTTNGAILWQFNHA